MTVATAVTSSSSTEMGLNARLFFKFNHNDGIKGLWPGLKKQVFQALDHHHIGKLHDFQESEQGCWQVLRVVEDCFSSHQELSDLLVSVQLEVSDQRVFERRYD